MQAPDLGRPDPDELLRVPPDFHCEEVAGGSQNETDQATWTWSRLYKAFANGVKGLCGGFYDVSSFRLSQGIQKMSQGFSVQVLGDRVLRFVVPQLVSEMPR